MGAPLRSTVFHHRLGTGTWVMDFLDALAVGEINWYMIFQSIKGHVVL